MRTKITVDRNGVVVTRDDYLTGERKSVTYFAPYGGGYVRRLTEDDRNPQVCAGLYCNGPTLRVRSSDDLPALIRRELRKRSADERREIT